jgi:hypothetical protein
VLETREKPAIGIGKEGPAQTHPNKKPISNVAMPLVLMPIS